MRETLALTDIQKLQFRDKARAEEAVLALMPQPNGVRAARVQLLPKPESLNSVNGYVTYENGSRYFFKAHTEENEKVSEYYNASILRDAGYPVVTAKQIAHQPGQQFVLYEILTFPTLFDMVKAEEDDWERARPDDWERARPAGSSTPSDLPTGSSPPWEREPGSAACQAATAGSDGFQPAATSQPAGSDSPWERGRPACNSELVAAQVELDCTVFQIYRKTLRTISADDDAKAPIHQLFYHRLQNDGRFGLFYKGHSLQLESESISFEELSRLKWTINGIACEKTLAEMVERSREALKPAGGAAIIGHGDAHNGNLFVDDSGKLLFFDPAFAGTHSPILDMVKPMFHNVFARWMYYPEQTSGEFDLSYQIERDRIIVNHSYQPSALRLEFLESRMRNVLEPTIDLLGERNMLPRRWEQQLRSDLFCCPFLTVNLFAPYVANGTLAERYPLKIKLLGLSMAMQLGSVGA